MAGSFGFGTSSESSSPTTIGVWDENQQALWNALSSFLQSGMYNTVPKYPGQLYTPTTQQDQSYFNYVNRTQGARQAALDQILSGTVPYEIGPEWAENYYERGVRDPMLREYEQVTLPGIKEAFAGPGYWGTARAGAQVKAGENLATTLGAQKASLMYGEEQAKRAAAEAALQRQALYGPGASATEAGIMSDAAAYSRQIENEKVLAELQRWLMGETVDGVSPAQHNPYIQLIFQALGLTPYAVGSESEGSSYDFNLGIK